MTTLSITEAKKNLGKWLKAAGEGEEVGIIAGSKIFALRPVTVHSDGYALQEYGVTREELERFADRAEKQTAKLRRAGKLMTIEQAFGKKLEKITPHRAKRSAKAARPSQR